MPSNHENQGPTASIRARAQELKNHDELLKQTVDAEAMASLIDGAISLEDLDDDTFCRCHQRLGHEHFVQALVAGRDAITVSLSAEQTHPQEDTTRVAEVTRFPRRQPGVSQGPPWWPRQGWLWVANAAAVAFIVTVFYIIDGPTTWYFNDPHAPRVAFHWPETPASDPSALTPWGPHSPVLSLPTGLPDFKQGSGTHEGSGDDSINRWRRATAIVKTPAGIGSGAFVAPEGWLLTTYHVVAGPSQQAALTGTVPTVEVILGRQNEGRLSPQSPVTAQVYRVDPVHDLALLKLETLPEGMNEVPFFTLATRVQPGEEGFVVGSQVNGIAWGVRSGSVREISQFPEVRSEDGASAAIAETTGDRTRATVIVTDMNISGGDAGGPLVNRKGELMGLTFATPTNQASGPVGWHIALKHLRSMVTAFPTQPEGVPFDAWTAGLPQAYMGTPKLTDGDQDGLNDTLIIPTVIEREKSPGPGATQVVAWTLFINLSQQAGATQDVADLTPVGLWGRAEGGRFRYDLFLTVRADGVLAVGYLNQDGIVDEIRLGSAKEDKVTLVWHRDLAGTWHATPSAGPTPFLDPEKFNEGKQQRVGAIYQHLVMHDTE